MSLKKKENKKIRNSYPSLSLEELQKKGLLPKSYHLYNHVEMEEYLRKKK